MSVSHNKSCPHLKYKNNSRLKFLVKRPNIPIKSCRCSSVKRSNSTVFFDVLWANSNIMSKRVKGAFNYWLLHISKSYFFNSNKRIYWNIVSKWQNIILFTTKHIIFLLHCVFFRFIAFDNIKTIHSHFEQLKEN